MCKRGEQTKKGRRLILKSAELANLGMALAPLTLAASPAKPQNRISLQQASPGHSLQPWVRARITLE